MPKPSSSALTPSPSAAELSVLKHLWASGPQSARAVQDAISPITGWSYSTTRTLLTRMLEKGLVERSEGEGVAVYAAKTSKVSLMGQMIRDFTANVLEIDGALPASAFTGSRLLSDDEADELMRLLEGPASEEGA